MGTHNPLGLLIFVCAVHMQLATIIQAYFRTVHVYFCLKYPSDFDISTISIEASVSGSTKRTLVPLGLNEDLTTPPFHQQVRRLHKNIFFYNFGSEAAIVMGMPTH